MANRDEVEEFLRRAAARRAAAQQQQQRPAAPVQPQQRPPAAPQGWPQPARPAPPPPPPQPLVQLQSRRPATLADVVILEPATVEAEVVDAELADQQDRLGRGVAQHMRGIQEIAEHTRHLGEEVDLADDKLEARLHEVFDHSVGQLKKQATDSVPKPLEGPRDQIHTLTSAGIAELMRSPQAIRNAIILGEILHRPVERW